MSAANRGDRTRMARRAKPILDRGPDLAPEDWRLARAMVAGDQQNDPVAARDRLFEPAVDRFPRGIQGQSVKVEDSVQLDRAGTQAPVPGRVERRSERWRAAQLGRLLRRRRAGDCWPWRLAYFRRIFSSFRIVAITR